MEDAVFKEIADTLLSGRYNLLIGSGASTDSKNRRGETLLSGSKYLDLLSQLKGLPARKYALQDVYSMLTDEEVENLVTGKFDHCIPGPTVHLLTQFIWSKVFTLNIDDALEAACESLHKKPQQVAVPINFTDPYQEVRDRELLQIIHLHGFTRRSADGYVFSKDQYVKLMRLTNPWMVILSQLIKSDPFIIAGTNLDEIDLRYYLSFRDEHSSDGARAPSILIEPSPDKMTEHKCQQFGLKLYTGTIQQFFDHFLRLFPHVPRVDGFVPVSAATRFSVQPPKKELASFLGDFQFVERATLTAANVQSKFFFGAPPSLEDFERKYDIERKCAADVIARLRRFVDGSSPAGAVFLLSDVAGAGKSTVAGRVVYDLTLDGALILQHVSVGRPDIERTAKLLNSLSKRALVVFDDAAESAPWLALLLPKINFSNLSVLLVERSYREEHIKTVLASQNIEIMRIGPPTRNELKQLVVLYGERGLLGSAEAIKSPGTFARRLQGDPLAFAVCRIRNDFRPIDQIAGSLLAAADANSRRRYLLSAIASLCYFCGIRLSLILRDHPRAEVQAQTEPQVPLPLLIRNYEGQSYVAPANRLFSERVLHRARLDFPAELKTQFFLLGQLLAPFVNRTTIMQGTPEARASRRLFNYDEVIHLFIPNSAEEFYEAMEGSWGWNSRYWEQKALLRLNAHNKLNKKAILTDQLRDAVGHARHAVSIERHPFPLTTLGSVLMALLDVKGEDREGVYGEAFRSFEEAISMETARSRVSIQPLLGLMKGTCKYIDMGMRPSADQVTRLRHHISDARFAFSRDPDIKSWSARTERLLSP